LDVEVQREHVTKIYDAVTVLLLFATRLGDIVVLSIGILTFAVGASKGTEEKDKILAVING